MKKISVLFVLFALLIGLTACNLPKPATPTLAPTIPATVTLPPVNTVPAPTETSLPVILETATNTPFGSPIPHLVAGSKVIITSIHMITVTNGWAIGRGSQGLTDQIVHTADGGNTWVDLTPPEFVDTTVGYSAQAYFLDDQNAWVTYAPTQFAPFSENGSVWFTHDGGLSWKNSVLDLSGIADYYLPGEMSFADASHGWILIHVGAGMSHDYVMLFSTADGGQTWTRLADPTTIGTFPQVCCKNSLSFPDAIHGWVTGDTHAVEPGIFFYQTSDAGVTWTTVDLQGPTENPGIFKDQNFGCGTYSSNFTDPQHGYFLVECTNYNNTTNKPTWLYTTGDGGATWVSHAMPAFTGKIQMINDQQGYYVAGNIYQTLDGGKNWKTIIPVAWDGTPDFMDLNHGWIVARAGDLLALVQSTNAGVNWTMLAPTIAP